MEATHSTIVAAAAAAEGMADRPRASAGEVGEELYIQEGILPATQTETTVLPVPVVISAAEMAPRATLTGNPACVPEAAAAVVSLSTTDCLLRTATVELGHLAEAEAEAQAAGTMVDSVEEEERATMGIQVMAVLAGAEELRTSGMPVRAVLLVGTAGPAATSQPILTTAAAVVGVLWEARSLMVVASSSYETVRSTRMPCYAVSAETQQ
jgi:hypothetical protein